MRSTLADIALRRIATILSSLWPNTLKPLSYFCDSSHIVCNCPGRVVVGQADRSVVAVVEVEGEVSLRRRPYELHIVGRDVAFK